MYYFATSEELVRLTALSGNNWQQNIINHKSAIGHAQVFNLRLGMLAKHVLYFYSLNFCLPPVFGLYAVNFFKLGSVL